MVDRIVPLAPSASRTIHALGAADRIIGRTEHGSGPGEVIGGWLTPDLDRIDDLDPDLVVTTDALQEEISDELVDRGHRTVHYDPSTLDEVLATIGSLGSAIGYHQEANHLVSELTTRIDTVRDRIADRPRPTVYCEEWQEPPMVAGNWVPDAVRVAGGHYPWLDAGERSQEIEQDAIEAVDPDHVVLHICGRGTGIDADSLTDRGWTLSAVEDGAVTVMPDHLLNQPSPSLVDGIERLARRLHPPTEDQSPADPNGRVH